MYLVLVVPKEVHDCNGFVYGVREDDRGRLVWKGFPDDFKDRVRVTVWYTAGWENEKRTKRKPFSFQINRLVVTGGEAEAITGLHMPAAMDRLRELVHESGGQ